MSTRFHFVSAQLRHFGSPPNTTVYVSMASGFHHRATVYTLCHRPYSESSTETAVWALAITIMNPFSRESPPTFIMTLYPPWAPLMPLPLVPLWFRSIPLFSFAPISTRSFDISYCWSLLVFISSFQAETNFFHPCTS